MTRPSPLAVVVLALLAEEPMHAYRMQQILVARRKDQVANIAQRNSIYQALSRLERDRLIAVRHTAREERRPERTIYEITTLGVATFRRWMLETLATPARQYPIFPAALAELATLAPVDVLGQLDMRAAALAAKLAAADSELARSATQPRVSGLEKEYDRELLRAELEWVRAVADDLRSGALTWSERRPSEIVDDAAGWTA